MRSLTLLEKGSSICSIDSRQSRSGASKVAILPASVSTVVPARFGEESVDRPPVSEA